MSSPNLDVNTSEGATIWGLLALCARPQILSQSRDEVRQRAAAIADWNRTIALAEYHGLAPLLYHHLNDHADALPTQASRQLRALYLRHRRGNEVRLGVLAEILEALEDIDIEPTVLKGAALGTLVYGDPGLRPLSDLDILVPQQDAVRAQRQLGEMGFTAPIPRSQYSMMQMHHLPAAVRMVDGVGVQVEIHHDVFSLRRQASLKVTGRAPGAIAFDAAGWPAYSLGPDEMVWHLCRHLDWLRLIWIADILGFTERFVEEIDWARVATRYPFVMRALAYIHCLAPLPDTVRQRAGVVMVPVPRGIGEEYRGWPGGAARVWDSLGGRLRFLRQTLSPSEWWLRFYHAADAGRIGLWKARLRHWTMLVRLTLRRAVEFLPRRRRPVE